MPFVRWFQGFQNTEERRKYLNQWIPRLHPKFRTGTFYHLSRLRQALKSVQQDQGKLARVMDAGCGTGSEVGQLRGSMRWLIGVDVDRVALKRNGRIDQAIRADLRKMPLPDGSVDVISSEFVVEHLVQPEQVFREWRRVLSPRGRIIFITPNRYNPWIALSCFTPYWFHRLWNRVLLKEKREIHPTWYRANSLNTIHWLATRSGLRVVTFHRAGNPGYLALNRPLALISIVFEQLLSLPWLRWMQMYLVIEMKRKHCH